MKNSSKIIIVCVLHDAHHHQHHRTATIELHNCIYFSTFFFSFFSFRCVHDVFAAQLVVRLFTGRIVNKKEMKSIEMLRSITHDVVSILLYIQSEAIANAEGKFETADWRGTWWHQNCMARMRETHIDWIERNRNRNRFKVIHFTQRASNGGACCYCSWCYCFGV